MMKSALPVAMLFCLIFSACGKVAPDDQVAGDVARSMCAKLKECGPDSAFDSANCEKGLRDSYLAALGFTGKKGKVKEGELKGCVAEIQALKCESRAEFTPPKTCTFLKK